MIRILPALLFCFASSSALAQEAIRQFPLPTVIALGVSLYQQDKIAADAFDFLYSAHPEARKLALRGWITENAPPTRRIYCLQGTDDQHLILAYTLNELPESAMKIQEGHGAPLPEYVAKRYAARQAAIAAITNFAPGRSYNFEVLDDPEHKGGCLVYALCCSIDAEEVVLGGHFRVTVSPEGKASQVDALSKSFVAVRKPAKNPKEAKSVALSVSRPASKTPLETDIYLSILHQIPILVSTSEHNVWKVSDATVTKMGVQPLIQPPLKPGAKFDLKPSLGN